MSLCGDAWLEHGDVAGCRKAGCECGSDRVPDPAQASRDEGRRSEEAGECAAGCGACGSAGGCGGAVEGEVIILSLPWPPSLNRYYRTVAGRILISAEGRRYCEDVQALLAGGFEPLTGRLGVTIHCQAPDNRRRDLDNLGKCLADSLTKAGIWLDDSQIDDLRFIRAATTKGGSVRVEIRKL